MATSDSKDDGQRQIRLRPTASAERPVLAARTSPDGLRVAPQTDDEDVWDAEAADALADVYAEAGHPIVDAAAWSHSPWLDTALITPRPRPPFIDQSWLEERLADIARHFEQTLLELKPDGSIAGLGERLDQAENRLTSAVSAVTSTQAAFPKQVTEAVTGALASSAMTTQLDRSVGKAVAVALKSSTGEVAEQVGLSVRAAVTESVATALDRSLGKSVTSAVKSTSSEVAEQVSLALRSAVAESVAAALDRSVAKAVTSAVNSNTDDVAEALSLSVKSALTDAVTLAVKSAVKSSVADAVADNVGTSVKSMVQDVVTLGVRGTVKSSVADAIADSMGSALSEQVSEAVSGALSGGMSGGMSLAIQAAVSDAMAQTLGDLPTKADIDGLYQINAQLNDILDRFDRTDERLARLDDLDGEVQALTSRLSDDRLDQFARLAASGSGSANTLSEADIEHAARTASEQVASEMLARMPGPGSGDSEQIKDIRALLETVISEQRQGDEMTSTMLDTLQQAMLTVLDRVDTLEATAGRLGTSTQSAAPPPRRDAAPIATDRGAATFDPDEIADRIDRMGTEPEPEPLGRGAAQRTERPALAEPVQPARRPPTDTSAIADRLPMRAPGANRRPETQTGEFISAARRAMRQSQPIDEPQAEAPALGAAQAQALPQAPPSSTEGRTPARARTLASDGPAGPAPRGRTDRRALLAVIAVLALGAGYQLLSRPDSGDATRQAAADRPTLASIMPEGPGTSEIELPIVKARAVEDTAETVGQIVEAVPTTVTAPAGVLLQAGGPEPTPREILALRARESAAYMSGRTGTSAFGAVGSSSALAIGVTPTAVGPVANHGATTHGAVDESSNVRPAGPATSSIARTPELELPPATVGPLSMRRAAQAGDPSAQFEVASRMAEARGTPQSFSGAVAWYTRAAEQGFAPAEFRLATMFERGLGVESDLARARDYYRRAAEKGHVKAMHNLAVLAASKTVLGEPDYATALPWFQRAATHGLNDSQFNLAVLLESGLGVSKDVSLAYKWQSLAARGGDKQAVKRRDVLALELDAVERVKLDAEVNAWRPTQPDRVINDARLAGEIWKSRVGKSS